MIRLLPNRVALYAFILALTCGLTACHRSVAPTEEELVGNCEQAVRITAEVSPFGDAPTGTRADVDGKVDNEHIDDWQPLSKAGTGGEVRISYLFLFVTKPGKDKIEQQIYYTAPGYQSTRVLGGKLSGTNIEAKELQVDATHPEIVSMELSLLPRKYSFYMIANSNALYEKIKTSGGLTNLSELQTISSTNTSFVADVNDNSQTTAFGKDFPILGKGDLTVPPFLDTSEVYDLSPTIKMERLFARIDLSLTTAKDNTRKEYLSADAGGMSYKPAAYKLVALNLLAADNSTGSLYGYPLLPVEGEKTELLSTMLRATGFTAPKIAEMTVSNPPSLETGTNTTEQFSWQKFINDGVNGGLLKLWQQPLFYTNAYKDAEDKPFHLYIPTLYISNPSNNSVRLELKFRKLSTNDHRIYRIPIHNETGAADYYSIRRNTIYDIDLTFYGSKLEVQQSNAKYIVDTWEDQPVDIPW